MTYKIENILACVDSSQYSMTVMKHSAYMAKAFSAKIKALHVIDVLQLEGPFMYDLSGALGLEPFSNFASKIKDILEEKGKNILTSFKDITDFYGVELSTKMEMGVVSSAIIEESKEFDIVFIGRKGINAAYERDILGSNIEPVIRKIDKPLFIANEHFYTPKNIVVAYDGSSVADSALEYAKMYQDKFGIELSVVNVGKDSKAADELFKELPQKFEKKFIESEDIPQAIVNFTNEKEMPIMFIGAYSKHRILEMILGSTTETILRKNIDFPLVVVR